MKKEMRISPQSTAAASSEWQEQEGCFGDVFLASFGATFNTHNVNAEAVNSLSLSCAA